VLAIRVESTWTEVLPFTFSRTGAGAAAVDGEDDVVPVTRRSITDCRGSFLSNSALKVPPNAAVVQRREAGSTQNNEGLRGTREPCVDQI